MTCAKIEEQLTAYLCGELSEKRADVLRKHLENCTHCRTELDGMREAMARVGEALAAAPEMVLDEERLEAIRRVESPARFRRETGLNGRLRIWSVRLRLPSIILLPILVVGVPFTFFLTPWAEHHFDVTLPGEPLPGWTYQVLDIFRFMRGPAGLLLLISAAVVCALPWLTQRGSGAAGEKTPSDIAAFARFRSTASLAHVIIAPLLLLWLCAGLLLPSFKCIDKLGGDRVDDDRPRLPSISLSAVPRAAARTLSNALSKASGARVLAFRQTAAEDSDAPSAPAAETRMNRAANGWYFTGADANQAPTDTLSAKTETTGGYLSQRGRSATLGGNANPFSNASEGDGMGMGMGTGMGGGMGGGMPGMGMGAGMGGGGDMGMGMGGSMGSGMGMPGGGMGGGVGGGPALADTSDYVVFDTSGVGQHGTAARADKPSRGTDADLPTLGDTPVIGRLFRTLSSQPAAGKPPGRASANAKKTADSPAGKTRDTTTDFFFSEDVSGRKLQRESRRADGLATEGDRAEFSRFQTVEAGESLASLYAAVEAEGSPQPGPPHAPVTIVGGRLRQAEAFGRNGRLEEWREDKKDAVKEVSDDLLALHEQRQVKGEIGVSVSEKQKSEVSRRFDQDSLLNAEEQSATITARGIIAMPQILRNELQLRDAEPKPSTATPGKDMAAERPSLTPPIVPPTAGQSVVAGLPASQEPKPVVNFGLPTETGTNEGFALTAPVNKGAELGDLAQGLDVKQIALGVELKGLDVGDVDDDGYVDEDLAKAIVDSETAAPEIDAVQGSAEPNPFTPAPPPPPETTEPSVFAAAPMNPFVLTENDRLSTFAMDTDTATYGIVRNYLNNGQLPPAAAIRIEEVINACDYDYPSSGQRTFNIYAEAAPSPFRRDLTLLKIGVKARVVGRDGLAPRHLVFALDTSGSMASPDRLPLVQDALSALLDELSDQDRVSVLGFARDATLLVSPTTLAGNGRAAVRDILQRLQCGGSTNLGAGLRAAYEVSWNQAQSGEQPLVILCSDGMANLGDTEAQQLLSLAKEGRERGIRLTSVGFGLGNYNDTMLEQLADRGDGSYVFVDTPTMARDAFAQEMSARLHVVAKDAKIQVEFNPLRVRRYRLLGYENRDIADQDFRNDSIDAGEVGSGKSVTALYELELQGDPGPDFGTVYVRYQNVETTAVEEIAADLRPAVLANRQPEESPRFFLAAAAAEFAELLRGSEYARNGSYTAIQRVLAPVTDVLDHDEQVNELWFLVERAKQLTR